MGYDLLSDPRNIFNLDETSFCVNPKLSKVLAKRGVKNVYTQTPENEKDCYTALLGGKHFYHYFLKILKYKCVVFPIKVDM